MYETQIIPHVDHSIHGNPHDPHQDPHHMDPHAHERHGLVDQSLHTVGHESHNHDHDHGHNQSDHNRTSSPIITADDLENPQMIGQTTSTFGQTDASGNGDLVVRIVGGGLDERIRSSERRTRRDLEDQRRGRDPENQGEEQGDGDLEEQMLEMELVDIPEDERDCNEYGRVGDVIEVWSETNKTWFVAGIVEILSETDVVVEYHHHRHVEAHGADMTKDGADFVSAKVVDMSVVNTDGEVKLWRRRPDTALSAMSGSSSRPVTADAYLTKKEIKAAKKLRKQEEKVANKAKKDYEKERKRQLVQAEKDRRKLEKAEAQATKKTTKENTNMNADGADDGMSAVDAANSQWEGEGEEVMSPGQKQGTMLLEDLATVDEGEEAEPETPVVNVLDLKKEFLNGRNSNRDLLLGPAAIQTVLAVAPQRFEALEAVPIQKNAGFKSKMIDTLAPGEVIVALGTEVVGSVTRVQCSLGWVSMTESSGAPLLKALADESIPDQLTPETGVVIAEADEDLKQVIVGLIPGQPDDLPDPVPDTPPVTPPMDDSVRGISGSQAVDDSVILLPNSVHGADVHLPLPDPAADLEAWEEIKAAVLNEKEGAVVTSEGAVWWPQPARAPLTKKQMRAVAKRDKLRAKLEAKKRPDTADYSGSEYGSERPHTAELRAMLEKHGADLATAFRSFDVNGDGKLSHAEFEDGLKQMNVGLAP